MRYRYTKARARRSSIAFSFRIFIPVVSVGIGVLILGWTLIPMISFFITHPFAQHGPISPLATQAQALGVSSIDYTKAQNWFPSNPQKKTNSEVDSYRLSIPKLNIKDAYVVIGSDDLDKSLIHYGGTGLPGQYGNTVIFGHSVLSQFFNPKDYKAIFSTLPTLKQGDEIIVNYDGVTYNYVVLGMRVVKPDDVTGLEQRYDNSYITLVTCVPPGTYVARLWVTARLKTS